jgi:2-phospho-L-lactate/phosphoenolpyruvate guanylyltransferase
VIPVKPLGTALGRLGPVLPAAARRELQWEMLGAVLSACVDARGLDEVLVVTGDPVVAGLAGAFGARVVADHDPPRGMNAAVLTGCETALVEGADAALVLTGDLPLIRPSDIDTIIANAPRGPGVVLAPSRDGTGTNAMLLAGPRVLTPQLGPGSLGRHTSQAVGLQLPAVRCELPTVALDIDTPEDLVILGKIAPEWVEQAAADEVACVVAGGSR